VATTKKSVKQKPSAKGSVRNAHAREVDKDMKLAAVQSDAGRRRISRAEQAAEIQRADLLAVATHDLRNPLGVVLVTATMLARELTGPHQLEQVAAIRRAALEMTHVIEDLTDGASIDAGSLELDPEDLVPQEIVEEALTTAKGLIGDRAISISLHVERSLPLVHGDRHRLQQVFSRISSNALRFLAKTGEVRIEATRSDDGVCFSVVDSGPLIPENQLAYAFLRRPPPGKRAYRGTGLGMFVVKGIVEAHGGHVELLSDAERGNRVSFTLPIRTNA
jgi:signal transduction histidine kinase